MYVIDVIPLSRTAPGTLSYRSSKKLAPGSLVEVTLRRRKTQGIVVEATPVREAKELLKRAHFQLSSSVPTVAGSLPSALMRAAEATARYHAATVGSVLAAVFGEIIRAGASFSTDPLLGGPGYERLEAEQPVLARAAAYAARITEDVQAKRSTLLVVPTIAETIFWKKKLAAHTPLVLSGTLAGARRTQAIERALTYAGLVIATPSFSWTPLQSLGSIIVERASAGTYTLPKRPYLHVPQSLEMLARAREVPIIYGDFPLPLECRKHAATAVATDTMPPRRLIDARVPKEEITSDAKPWVALPNEVIAGIAAELKDAGSAVVLAVRKGYAPAVVCRDCGQAQVDARGMPYSFTMRGERRFMTADGISSIPAQEACSRCGSWNLLPLGVGVERVLEELRTAFPDARICAAEQDAIASPKKAAALVSEGLSPGSILVGTESLLPWLYVHAPLRPPLGIVASADSLLALPFWRARERFVRLSFLLAGACRELLLVTRRAEDAAVEAVISPERTWFWEEEVHLRTALLYPPFGRLVHVAIEDAPHRARLLADRIMDDLAIHAPHRLEERPVPGRAIRIPILLQVSSGDWPDDGLVGYLASLPPTARVRIDPDSVW